jgi:hypothetical protein
MRDPRVSKDVRCVASKRAASRPAPVHRFCTECPNELKGKQRLVCSSRCRDGRFKRLHPEAYAERERRKVARDRERRRLTAKGGPG